MRTAPPFYRELTRLNDSVGGAVVIGISILIVLFILYLWFFPRTVASGLLDSNSVAPAEAASAVRKAILEELAGLASVPIQVLLDRRREKYRRAGTIQGRFPRIA